MSEVYVYGPNNEENNYATMGLVGALVPTSVEFNETTNGESTLTMEHPLDIFGRYAALERGNILVAKVPVRTVPEIQNGKCVTTVWTYKCKPADQMPQYGSRCLFSTIGEGWSVLATFEPGEIVTVVEKSENENDRWKVRSSRGNGYIDPEGFELVTEHKIEDNSGAIEEVQSPWKCMSQMFRIYEVQKNIDNVQVSARHISYDLLKNVTFYQNRGEADLQTALDGILQNCYADHKFKAYTNVDNKQVGVFARGKNVIEALLDPEEGICKKYDVNIVRDNYNLYFLHDPGLNRGVRIQYGKNMTGINYTESEDELATRIIPVGENEDGTPLFLSDKKEEQYIDSPNIDKYPMIHAYWLECEDATVGEDEYGNAITVEVVRGRMRKQVQDLFDAKCDEPDVSIEVDFLNLGDTEEYKQFRNLENCFLYDYVLVQYGKQNIDITAQISSITWDCMLDRMTSMTVGKVGVTQANTGITTWQIPSGFSGSKIAPGTTSGSALKSNIISTRHLQANSVNADVIAAGAITADKIAANSLNALIVEAIKAKFDTIESGSIETDDFYASIARVGTLIAGEAVFDFETVRHLVAEALHLKAGIADEIMITNLAVSYAQMLSATIGNLCLKASDGKYYTIDIDQNGNVTATEKTVTDSEIEAGETSDSKVILGTDILADHLNTNTLKASFALLNEIDATRIDVDKLFAREAFINHLNTADIRSNKYIQMLIGEAAFWRVEVTSDVDILQTIGESATLSGKVFYGSIDKTADYPASRFRWRRSGDDPEADKIWNQEHRGMKSVVIEGGQADYNAVYYCDMCDTIGMETSDGDVMLDSENKELMVLEAE